MSRWQWAVARPASSGGGCSVCPGLTPWALCCRPLSWAETGWM